LSNLNPRILEKLTEWKKSPLIFAHECIDWRGGKGVTTQQVEALQAVTKERRISIRSGHGCGKDAVSALIALWFMATRPGAKVVVTAPTNRQLNDIFWSELSKWFKRSLLQDEFVQQKDKFFHKSDPKGWWIRIVSPQVSATKDSQAETLAGFHGDHLLIIADEASGIPDPFFIPLEGAMTSDDNKAILIGNMTKNTGYFYDTHFHSKLSKRWYGLHWDSRKSSIVTKDMVQFFEDKYGVDSNVFAIRVAGNPPKDNANTLISLYDAKECMKNDIEPAEDEPLYLSADIARYGEDVSIILPRKGLKLYPWETHDNLNTISLGGHINQAYQELDADGLSIDEIGVGAGVTDWLQKHGHIRCFGINVAAKSSNIAKYDRLRDELWIAVRDKCVSHVYDIPDTEEGEELCNELASPTYDFNVHGGYKIESKREMKARGVMSPNIADSVGLSEYFSNVAYKVWGKRTKVKSKRPFYSRLVGAVKGGWQTA
jgi:hypothetical protein